MKKLKTTIEHAPKPEPTHEYPFYGVFVGDTENDKAEGVGEREFIVLFTAPGKGIVVATKDRAAWKVGEGIGSADWSMSSFEKFTGSVTIN